MADDRTSELDRWRTAGSSHTHTARRGNGTPIACGRSPTGAVPIADTTFYATLIKSDIGHGDYMQPRWFFCVNRRGRPWDADAPNGPGGRGVIRA